MTKANTLKCSIYVSVWWVAMCALLWPVADKYIKRPFKMDKVTVVKTEVDISPWSHHYFFKYDDGKIISPWHDVPLHAGTAGNGDKLFHFICEIPKGTTAKMEIHKSFEHNPIVQDTKKGKLREYKYKPEAGSTCNYGALPQTWEDPSTPHPDTQAGGDNDPIDVLQINDRPCTIGEIYKVRVLGTLAMVDDGETDWKLIVVDEKDDATKSYKDIGDVPKEKVDGLREWFRMYKTAEGKGENKFGLDEKAMDKEYTIPVVEETFDHWKAMMNMKPKMGMFQKVMNKIDKLVEMTGLIDIKVEKDWKRKHCTFDDTPCWTGKEGKK
jgi:inorganic pyrophosphatase